VNIPANAPHAFKNASAAFVRMLCMATPAGLEIGERQKKAASLSAKCHIEIVQA
jgi:hypothetical protein